MTMNAIFHLDGFQCDNQCEMEEVGQLYSPLLSLFSNTTVDGGGTKVSLFHTECEIEITL